MARNEGVDFLSKRNSKLDSFLKRNLDHDDFEKIRAYESCVVTSDKENKAFKFVVLSDEYIFLTENPPKTVQQAVCLDSVISIDLLNDYPEFLNGDQRDNTLHICVTYLKPTTVKDKKVQARCTPYSGSSEMVSDPRLWSQQTPNGTMNGSSSGGLHPHYNPQGSMLSVGSTSRKGGAKSHHKQLSSSYNEADFRALQQDGHNISKNPNSHSKSTLSLSLPESDIKNLNLSPGDGRANSRAASPCCGKGGKPYADGGGTFPDRRGSGSDIRTRSENSYWGSNGTDTQALLSGTDTTSGFATGEAVPGGKSPKYFRKSKRKFSELHLYILTRQSPILMHMRSAWNNYMMRVTLDYDQRSNNSLFRQKTVKLTSEQLEMLFSQLKNELLTPGNSLVTMYRLVRELKIACEKNFTLKKLFWRNQDLLPFFICQIQLYLPTSPANLKKVGSRKSWERRSDELEYVVLLKRTIAMLFRETEILPSRLSSLKANKGKYTCDLISAITCVPEMPTDFEVPTSKTATKLFDDDPDYELTHEDELSKLYIDWTIACCSVMFELLSVGHQASWGLNQASNFNICWMMKQIEQQPHIDNFLSRAMMSCMAILNPACPEYITTSETVVLYQIFHTFEIFAEYSKPLIKSLADNYAEEFRYYIHVSQKRLVDRYPITKLLLAKMENVTHSVLKLS